MTLSAMNYLLYFGTVPTVWYSCFCFSLCSYILYPLL